MYWLMACSSMALALFNTSITLALRLFLVGLAMANLLLMMG
jgi:hypothetical protein